MVDLSNVPTDKDWPAPQPNPDGSQRAEGHGNGKFAHLTSLHMSHGIEQKRLVPGLCCGAHEGLLRVEEVSPSAMKSQSMWQNGSECQPKGTNYVTY